jgi:hypothetical protein
MKIISTYSARINCRNLMQRTRTTVPSSHGARVRDTYDSRRKQLNDIGVRFFDTHRHTPAIWFDGALLNGGSSANRTTNALKLSDVQTSSADPSGNARLRQPYRERAGSFVRATPARSSPTPSATARESSRSSRRTGRIRGDGWRHGPEGGPFARWCCRLRAACTALLRSGTSP